MPDKQKRNILLKLLPKEIADHLIMHLQGYPTFNILKQHALNTVDMLSKCHKDVKTTNLLHAAESDDDWNNDEVECSPCNDDDENNPLNQIMAMFKKKFGGASSGNTSSGNLGKSRCLNCGDVGHHISDCPKPEVPKNERPCFKCGKPGHVSAQCKSTPSTSGKVSPRVPFKKRPPANAKAVMKALDSYCFTVTVDDPREGQPPGSSSVDTEEVGIKKMQEGGQGELKKKTSPFRIPGLKASHRLCLHSLAQGLTGTSVVVIVRA